MNKIAAAPALRAFTEFDWYGYAGADSWADGSVPLINDDHRWMPSADFSVVVIADLSGVEVGVYDTVGDSYNIWHYAPSAGNRALTTAIAAGLPVSLGPTFLEAAGFTRVG